MTPTAEGPSMATAETPPTEPDQTEAEIDLTGEVDRLTAALGEMRTERDAWRDRKMPDPEAEAIAGCAKALDALTGQAMATYSSNVSNFSMVANVTAVRRILRFLAERYGVSLEPNVQVLCQHEDAQ